MEELTLLLRDLMHRLTDKNDEKALRDIIMLILSSREDKRKLKIIMQLLHDEKTFILSDTEILKQQETQLLRKAALYHVLYEIARGLAEASECRLSEDKLREAVTELNLSDIAECVKHALACSIQGRQEQVDIIRRVADEMKLPDRTTPPALGVYLVKFLLEEYIHVHNLLREII